MNEDDRVVLETVERDGSKVVTVGSLMAALSRVRQDAVVGIGAEGAMWYPSALEVDDDMVIIASD